MPKNDGGPAFPAIPGDKVQGPCCYWGGMSLRDWFAGQALVGLVPFDLGDEKTVTYAYMIANAMLAEREKEPEHE